VAWYQQLLRRPLALGYDGWMHDFGEYVPRKGRFFDGRRGDAVHNPYPMLSAKAARAVLQAEKPDDHLFFVRAGWTGSQAVAPAVWGGDPEADFDETQGLPAMLRGGLNLGLSAVPYWGSDMTGFKCLGAGPRDKEIFIRWLELGAVSPIMMDQNACSNPLEKRTKWGLFNDEETIDAWRQMAKLHTRLQPYFLTLAREAAATGMPLMRHPVLTHPDQPEALKVEDAFFLGPALYAAPVVRRGVTVRKVWLPPGRYVSFEERTVYEGGREVDLPAPLDRLPLLLVAGQLLPLLDASVQTLAPASVPSVVTASSRADVLDVRVALAPGQAAQLTLADGTTLRAERTGGGDRRQRRVV
jgi:alpha-glucosidase (family GH31 glycosyl hydrolase)